MRVPQSLPGPLEASPVLMQCRPGLSTDRMEDENLWLHRVEIPTIKTSRSTLAPPNPKSGEGLALCEIGLANCGLEHSPL
mmetsp:Transcript_26729/g.41827  ORF Transcript_26729/g.41827 Transcript_26729/m.41827 type:complete len:80 (+) Transcript_26729:354-593(+)